MIFNSRLRAAKRYFVSAFLPQHGGRKVVVEEIIQPKKDTANATNSRFFGGRELLVVLFLYSLLICALASAIAYLYLLVQGSTLALGAETFFKYCVTMLAGYLLGVTKEKAD